MIVPFLHTSIAHTIPAHRTLLPKQLADGNRANAQIGKAFDPYEFSPAIQVAFGKSVDLASANAAFDIADLYIPNDWTSAAMQSFTQQMFNMINKTVDEPEFIDDLLGVDRPDFVFLLQGVFPDFVAVSVDGTSSGGITVAGAVSFESVREGLQRYFGTDYFADGCVCNRLDATLCGDVSCALLGYLTFSVSVGSVSMSVGPISCGVCGRDHQWRHHGRRRRVR